MERSAAAYTPPSTPLQTHYTQLQPRIPKNAFSHFWTRERLSNQPTAMDGPKKMQTWSKLSKGANKVMIELAFTDSLRYFGHIDSRVQPVRIQLRHFRVDCCPSFQAAAASAAVVAAAFFAGAAVPFFSQSRLRGRRIHLPEVFHIFSLTKLSKQRSR